MQDKKNNADTVYEADKTVLETLTVCDNETVADGPVKKDAPFCAIQKGAKLLDTYRIESDAIEGGMGRVWRVHHTGWNVDLAMKQPKGTLFQTEQQKDNFIHECEAWIGLGLHPHIVSCHYVREINGTPTIFSEWMDGGSLKNVIENGSLYEGNAEERLLDIAIQFARGLHYAHECRDENGQPKGLIHQDVKPDNLLLTMDGEAKVADFGISKARAVLTMREGSAEELGDYADSGRTMYAASGGYTPAYCSMEQMNGQTLTRRTDIYSWAVSVMEMYLGERLWANGVIAGAACESYFPKARVAVSKAMQALLKECLNENEKKRPHDFSVIEKQLLAIYEEQTGNEYPRLVSKAAADTADSLNNRALSFLDLGKPDEAERYWETALALEPLHPAAQYNRSIERWRHGKIDDQTTLLNFETVCAGNPQYAELCGRLKESLAREAQAGSQLHVIENKIKKAFYIETGSDGFYLLAGMNTAFIGSEENEYERFFNIDDLVKGCIRLFFHEDDLCALTEKELLFFDSRSFALKKQLSITLPEEYLDGSSLSHKRVFRCFSHFHGGDLFSASANYFNDYDNDDYGNEITFLLNLQTGEVTKSFRSVYEPTAVGFGTNGGYVVTAYRYGFFKCRNGEEAWHSGGTSDKHSANVNAICFFSSSSLFLTCSADRSVKLWDAASKKCIRTFEGHKQEVLDVVVVDGGRYVVSADKFEMRIWELRSGKCAQTLKLPAEAVSLCALGTNGIIVGLKDGGLVRYRLPDFSYKSPYKLNKIKTFKQSFSEQSALTLVIAKIKRLISDNNIAGALDAIESTEKQFGIQSQSALETLREEAGRCCRRRGLKYHRLMAQYSLHRTRFLECNPETVLLADNDESFIYVGNYTAAALVKADVKTGEVRDVFSTFRAYLQLFFSSDAKYAAKLMQISDCLVQIQIRSTVDEKDYHSFRYNPQEINGTLHFSLDNRFLAICDTRQNRLKRRDIWLWDIEKREAPSADEFFCTVIENKGRSFILTVRDDRVSFKEVVMPTAADKDIKGLSAADNAAFHCLSKDFTFLLTVDPHDVVRVYRLVWEYAFPGWADWDEGARPYIDIFLSLHTNWTDEDFNSLICELQNRGFGWLRPDGVRAKLKKIAG